MSIFLGLGSNQGDRRNHLEQAIDRLVRTGFRVSRISPVVESPAMLPAGAPADWDRPYLNLVIVGTARWSPREALDVVQCIEREAGRIPGPRWSPRPLDIDILLWGQERICEPDLTIPHPGLSRRDFVITPLLHIAPGRQISGLQRTVFDLSSDRRNIPIWMGILNITPDSFSDGGAWADRDELADWIDRMVSENIQIIDVGAESTRPHANEVPVREEWARIKPALELLFDRLRGVRIRPRVSLDSRHPEVIRRGLALGIDIINDVTGLDDPEMVATVRDCDCDVVAMHAMTVPVNPAVRLPDTASAVTQMCRWIEKKKSVWARLGIDTDRIIFDPGIGFGKTSVQATELLSHIRELRQSGQRLLIGHSRKSFMTAFTDRPPSQRDLETLGISLALAEQGVDIIRIHHPMIHQRAYRAWCHVVARRPASGINETRPLPPVG